MESGLTIGGVIAVIGLSFIASPAHAYDPETIGQESKSPARIRGAFGRGSLGRGEWGRVDPRRTQGKNALTGIPFL